MNNLTLIDYSLEATVKPRVSCGRLSVVKNITLNALRMNVDPLPRYKNKTQTPLIGSY